ncbi:hypothetical protein D5N88_15655 [Salmonella enterica subsp. enterica serovar Panama]|nr:hypothetical protein [Salmonella enterica subsp. enterica serovar Panama]
MINYSDDKNDVRKHVRKTVFWHKKTACEGGLTTLLFIDFIAFSVWYPERDLNPHSANAEGF